VVTDILNEAWGWFKERVGEIVETIVDAVLKFVSKIIGAIDEALEFLWRNLVKPVLDLVLGILGRIFGFAWDVVEVVYSKVVDAFKAVYGFVSVYVYEIELRIHDIVVSAVRMVYDAVTSMFVNVYNVVRGVYVGVRDVTYMFVHSTVRRIRERLHTIITVDLWILGCWKAFQGSLESFSFGDFLKSAVLCLMAPVASGYIAGIITSLTPTPGTEFPGFIPPLEFPELSVEDLPGFSVVAPPPVSFPTVGVSTLPFAPVMDLGVRYEVVGVVFVGFVLSDSVDVGLGDAWGWSVGFNYDLSDSAGLSLVDSWVGGYVYSVDDSIGLGLSDSWSVSLDEVSLVRSVGFDPSYPAVVDVVDLVGSAGLLGMYGVSDSVSLRLLDRLGLLVDEISLGEFVGLGVGYTAVITVDGVVITEISTRVSYPAVVDVFDLIKSAGLVGFYGLSDSVGLGLSDGWRALLDEVSLVKITGFNIGYPAVVDVVDFVVSAGLFGLFGVIDSVSLMLSDGWRALLDEVSLIESVGFGVRYPAIVDVIDVITGVGLSWEVIFSYGVSDGVDLSLVDSWGYSVG
jgi:hypothetical protein